LMSTRRLVYASRIKKVRRKFSPERDRKGREASIAIRRTAFKRRIFATPSSKTTTRNHRKDLALPQVANKFSLRIQASSAIY